MQHTHHTHYCKIGNKIVPYHWADTGKNRAPENFVINDYLYLYTGVGTIYSVFGVKQEDRVALHFWIRVKIQNISINYE